jgi:drug/metabolite transporter (DMT)-like permease
MDPVGAAVLVVASLAWAVGSLWSKHGELPSSPLLGVTMQGLCGGAALWIGGLFSGEVASFTPRRFRRGRGRLWVIYLFLDQHWIFGFLFILKKSTAAGYVCEPVALFIGWLLAGEALSQRTLLAAAVILTAVVLVITAPHRTREAEDALPAPGEA